jgi:ribosomal protein S18 acetylase RimI-like enzyme
MQDIKSFKFRYNKDIAIEQLLNLYTDAEWTTYTKHPNVLENAVKNSLCVISVWDNDILIGLLRAIGDSYSIIYIQDILVLKSHRRMGIGKYLIQLLLEKYKDVRQIVLLTDSKEDTLAFYKNVGMKNVSELNLSAFVRIKNA